MEWGGGGSDKKKKVGTAQTRRAGRQVGIIKHYDEGSRGGVKLRG